MGEDFLYRDVPALKRRVFRLGLAGNYGISEDGVRAAFDAGVNYVFWTPTHKNVTAPLKERLKVDRERMVVASGPTLGYFGGSVRRGAEKLLRVLGTDYLDVLQVFWVGVTSALTEGVLGEMVKLKEEGKVRALGVSIHDRERAGRLAEDSPLDLFMIRYNAAHPGAERDIFPHLQRRHPAVVAYTATRWRKLLSRPKGWEGPVMRASDCYRFCLSNPNVDVVLTGPKSAAEFAENLTEVQKGPLSEDELAWIRPFGKVVHDTAGLFPG